MPKTAKKGKYAAAPAKPVANALAWPNLTPPPTGVPEGLNTPSLPVGMSVEEMVRKSNYFRDNYNPLRGFTMARLTALMEQAERGAYPEIQLTLRKAEKRFPVLKGFIEKLLSAVEELKWDVNIIDPLPEGVTQEQAEAQQKFLKSRYQLLTNLKQSIGQLVMAEVRGYAILQKHRYQDGPNDGAVKELYWLEPWCFSRDGFYGDFFYNQNSLFGVGLGSCNSLGESNRIGSDALPRGEFVIRECESPLYEIALIAMVNWLMARKDYAAFVEIFGLPNSIVIMPPNIPPGKESDYQSAAENVARGISGALPNGADAKFPTAGTRTESPFDKFTEAQEKDVVLAGTGGMLTMISAPTGIGKGASEEHDGAWQAIAVNKSRRVSETLQRDFDAPELAAQFPGQPVAVYFELATEENEDVSTFLDNVIKGDGIGLEVSPEEISERSGINFTKKPEPVTPPGVPGAVDPNDPLASLAAKAAGKLDDRTISEAVRNRLVKMLNRAGASDEEQFIQAIAADLQPLRDRLAAIESISDPDLQKQKLAVLYGDLDQIAQNISADPEAARVLAAINGKALVDGLKNQPETKA